MQHVAKTYNEYLLGDALKTIVRGGKKGEKTSWLHVDATSMFSAMLILETVLMK